MPHVVLLGDSVFDNAAYVPGGPDVIRQVQKRLPGGWHATLRAVDGATTAGVPGQVQRLPPDATHLVVSVGGNDALGHIGVLEDTAPSIAHALEQRECIGRVAEADGLAVPVGRCVANVELHQTAIVEQRLGHRTPERGLRPESPSPHWRSAGASCSARSRCAPPNCATSRGCPYAFCRVPLAGFRRCAVRFRDMVTHAGEMWMVLLTTALW